MILISEKMSCQKQKILLALIVFAFSQIGCFAQTYSEQAVYINQSDALWEMFIFDTTGNFEYKTVKLVRLWVGAVLMELVERELIH